MASWSNATITAKGYALQAKLLSTDALVITRVVAGSGRATAGQLVNQTTVSEEKQTLSVESLSYDSNGNAIIKTSLNNKGLTSGYTCHQIGIYASDPDEGEILYAIAQEASAGEDIPSITEQPNGYYCAWVFALTFSNSSNISVTIDTANALTIATADFRYSNKGHRHAVSDLKNSSCKAADGYGAFCLGGYFNTASEQDAMCLGGDSNNASAEKATTINGFSNTASGEMATCINGFLNTANGMYAITLGGYSQSAKGDCSGTTGHGTIANNYQFVAGKFNKEVAGPTDFNEQSADSSVFIVGYGSNGDARANALRVSSAGKCYGSAAFVSSGADFPEFEEWADGNPENEDRRGLFVALEGDKIVLATSEKDHIIGVVSVMGAFIANGASENWRGMYLKDVFGENLTQQVNVPEKTIEKKVIEEDAEGNKVVVIKEEVIPAHTVTQFVINPDYNPDEEYIGREFRKEWAPVGKLGQVIVVDDGTCTVGGYCKPSANGIGTAGEYGYYVRKRIDSTHIKVEISPGAFNK